MKILTIEAPTKINLRLKVTGKRPDGYHYLSMLNEKLALSDKITIELSGDIRKFGGDLDVDLVCPGRADLETDSNLVIKAAKALATEAGVASPLRISVEKKIPVGAGLGGGSSDAAATILALNRLWNLNKSQEELARIGVTIGADVPFFMWDGPAKVTGIGELVDRRISLPKLWVLLVNPGFEVSTKWVYGALDLELTANIEDDRFPAIFKDLCELHSIVENDLEPVVRKRHKEILEMEDYLKDCGACFAFMSGSGPTVVGIFASKDERDSALLGNSRLCWDFFPTESQLNRR